MTLAKTTPEALIEQWQAAWPVALATWSKYTRLHDPRLCSTQIQAAKEGLSGSFAMIRLRDQSVVVDLESVIKLKLEDYAVEILAHEIGHHVLAPSSVTDQFRLLARMRRALPTLERHAPMVANLYTDLLINDRLQRQSQLRLADIYRKLTTDNSSGGNSAVWNLYLRIYENLWKLPVGNLGASKGNDRAEADAWLGSRLVRVYASDWMTGGGRFATLVLPYLLEDADKAQKEILSLMDTASAASGCEPYGGIEIEADELGGVLHPSEDPAITGVEKNNAQDEKTYAELPHEDQSEKSQGQAREPFEYGEILAAAGIKLSEHEVAIRYYRERALPYLVPFPVRQSPTSPEPLIEGLEPWDIGDPLDKLDWLQTIVQSPRVIPGLTTAQRMYGSEQSQQLELSPLDLDLYVDSSGSMPDPRVRISYMSLAGAIVALSALRAGASVQVTLWSGKDEYMHTRGFVRDEHEVLRILTDFYGGGTCFPIHRLRETFCEGNQRKHSAHILMISDDGITTMFDNDERGNSGWDVSAKALAAAKGGGTMALNLPASWEQIKNSWSNYSAQLIHAREQQGWEIFAITALEDLIEFAHAFSRRHYT
jgi:hypothetical protein